MHEGKIAQKNKWRHKKVLLIWGIVRRPMKKEKNRLWIICGKKDEELCEKIE